MATIPNSNGPQPPVAGVWLTSTAKTFVLRDGPSDLDPVRELKPGVAQFFFSFRPGRFRFDPDVSEVEDEPAPKGEQLAKMRAADAAQRQAKIDALAAIEAALPRAPQAKAPEASRTPAQILASRRASANEPAAKDPVDQS